jgi:hypothetical protein
MRSISDSVDAYSDTSVYSAVNIFNVKLYACQVFCVG